MTHHTNAAFSFILKQTFSQLHCSFIHAYSSTPVRGATQSPRIPLNVTILHLAVAVPIRVFITDEAFILTYLQQPIQALFNPT